MIRYGIAGFGLHAVKRLLPGFAKAQNSKLVALSRRSMEQAQRSAAEHHVELVFDSVEALCASPQVDAVFVTTPNSRHLRDVLSAISHSKPVLCEKPMALNATEARQMVTAARTSGVFLGVAHCFRFEASVERFRQRIAAGDIGTPVLARAEFSYWGVGHPRAWMTDLSIAGGGPIADIGVHCIDSLRYILQDEIAEVGTLAQRDQHSGEAEASAQLNLKFLKGTLGSIAVSLRTQYRTPVEIIGTEGTLRAYDAFNVERPINLQLWRNSTLVDEQTLSNFDTYALQLDAFSAAIEQKRDFEIPGEEGLKNQLVLDAAYRSIRSGRIEPVSG